MQLARDHSFFAVWWGGELPYRKVLRVVLSDRCHFRIEKTESIPELCRPRHSTRAIFVLLLF